jgi:hypothetical protein
MLQAVLKHANFRQGRFMIRIRVDAGVRRNLAVLSPFYHEPAESSAASGMNV